MVYDFDKSQILQTSIVTVSVYEIIKVNESVD